jgi:hypothetical protein
MRPVVRRTITGWCASTPLCWWIGGKLGICAPVRVQMRGTLLRVSVPDRPGLARLTIGLRGDATTTPFLLTAHGFTPALSGGMQFKQHRFHVDLHGNVQS